MTMSKCFSATAADPITSSDPLHTHSPEPMESDSQSLVVVSFYKFADFPDHADLRKPLKQLCQDLYVSGGIILAPEGINGSICGTRESVERVLEFIQTDDRLKGLRQIESPVSPEQKAIHHGHSSSSPLSAGEDAPFRWDHVRVKLKKEIVTLGMPDVSPIEKVGKYVSPKDWNALITDPDTVVIDVRNDYEIRIGKFKGAVDPCTKAFCEFPSWVDNQFKPYGANVDQPKLEKEGLNERIDDDAGSPKQKKPKRVAMYCTGGIRCEKASSFMLSKGFDEVYHLKGGILKYLEEIPKTESLWEGECFVFDKPVAVEQGVVQGNFKLCYGCKQPVSDADMEAPEWEYGVSCPYCYSTKSEEEKERARARQRQFESWGIIGGPDKGRRPAVKADSIKSGQNMGDSDTRKIRNICILAHVDHGKTTLADHLIAATGGGLLHPKLAGKLRFMDYLDEEQRRAITMKSSSIALHYKVYEVNLIDSPGHMDFCSEVSTAARLSDGGLVLVDAVEGVHIQTHAVLRQAWIEKVTPCLVLNKIDRLICELKLSPMEAYTRLLRIVLEVNGIMSTYKSEKYLSDVDSILAGPTGEVSDETLESIEDDEEDTFQPQKGNVAFVCALDGWGFTINEFAKFYASKLGANISTLMKAFWGPRYFNPKTKMIVGKKGLGAGCKARPMFVQFVLEPLWQVYQAALEPDGDKGTLEKVIKSFNLSIPLRELQNKDPKIVLQAVMSRWLPLSDAVLSMVVNCMPDPISAQSFRTSRLLPKRELLNKGVDSNVLAEADLVRKSVEACDSSPEAPCVAFVSKMFTVPTKMLPQRGPQGEVLNNFTDEGGTSESDECFLAFARIFSGVLTSGQRVFVLSALYDPLRGESMQKHMQEAELQSLYLMMGQGLKPVTSARAGNIVAIRGLGQHILKTATLLSTKNCWPFSSMAFQVSPTLRVAIEPSDPADMGALMKGLRLLNRADPFVEVTVSSRGEHVLAAAGEVHLERCIKDLKDRFAKVSLEVSPPLVSYKETIEGDLSNALEDLKQFSADSDYVEKITSNGRCTIRVKVIKLPPTLTKVLDECADLLSDIIGGKLGQSGESLEMHTLSLTENESPIEVLRKRIVEALETDFFCGIEKDKDQLEKCKGKWLKLLTRIWALGPRQVGPNILFTPDYKSENDDGTILIHGSPYVSLRLGLADSSSADDIAAITSSELTRPLYGEAESLESSLMSGFQLAAAAGPLCDEPMWGLAFVVEAYISPSTVQAGESKLNQQAEQYGLLTGQIMSAVKDACRGAVLQRKPRLVEAMYFCELNTPTEFLGPMYAVLSRRRARVVKEEMQEGSPLFTVHAYVPVSESFGFADELRRWTSGASSALLVLSHWEALPEDPFFVPKTEEEIEEFGDGASVLPNTARKLIDAVRRRKGLPVEEKVVQHATKQRTLARKV